MHGEWIVSGGDVFGPDAWPSGTAVRVEKGRIAAIGPFADLDRCGLERLEADGLRVIPGLIDTHIHGGLHADTMHADPDALRVISSHLARHGVTAWTPTAFALPAAKLEEVLSAMAIVMVEEPSGATVLGAHLESPFISERYKGAQPAEHLRAPGDVALRDVIARFAATVRIVTLAPELEGSIGLIAWLRHLGITVAMGHCDASYEAVLAGEAAGATRVTHLCNAMRPFHHREPGTVGASLVRDGLYAEIIADLVHVHPAGLLVAYRCKGRDRLMLVSDALMGTGLPPGKHDLEGRELDLAEVARLSDGTIAGSVITLERALANMVEAVGVPFSDAVAMATRTPAASLGLADRGRLAVGYRADLALLAPDGRCVATMVGGNLVWCERHAAAR